MSMHQGNETLYTLHKSGRAVTVRAMSLQGTYAALDPNGAASVESHKPEES